MNNHHIPLVSVVVPAYNELENLPELYRQLCAVFKCMDAEMELLVVDDSSTDGTLTWLQEISKTDRRVQFVSFARNFGHQAAVSAGLQFASGDVVVIMDADLQDPPQMIPRMMKRWNEGFQVIMGKRIQRSGDPLSKRLFAWAYYRILSFLSPVKIPVDGGDFCLMDRVVVDTLNSLPERNRYVRGLRAWAGFRHTEQPFRRQERLFGKPKYGLLKSITLAFDGLVSFSHTPLRLATLVGVGTGMLALIMAGLVIYWRIFTNSPLVGYATIITAFLIFTSMQMITIGIMGEYIGRIYDEVKNRPNYVVKEARFKKSPQDVSPIPMQSTKNLPGTQTASPHGDTHHTVTPYAGVTSGR